MLSQIVQIAYPLDVYQVVAMGTYAYEQHLSESETKKIVETALETVDMTRFYHRNYLTLSGGERKRILLAKCLVQLEAPSSQHENKYLFLDEPAANLDVKQKFKILQLVKELARKKNLGVFAVLHDLNLAAQFADELLILKSGRLLDMGTPEVV
ncbi:MAG: ATP-binding cassette domain-containing protein, partial [Bacteroidota bacterium]